MNVVGSTQKGSDRRRLCQLELSLSSTTHRSSGISSAVPTTAEVGGYLLIVEAAAVLSHHDSKRSSGSGGTRFLITVSKDINFLAPIFSSNGIYFSMILSSSVTNGRSLG